MADFARLDEVRALAATLLERYPAIDVLANNAGGIMRSRETTADGHETTFQVNHLAPFLLTTLLLPRLADRRATVIMTSSMVNLRARLDLDDLNAERHYSGGRAGVRQRQARQHPVRPRAAAPPRRFAHQRRLLPPGRRRHEPDIAASALTEKDCPLSDRELEVLRAARTGASIKEIADRVHLAPGTVRNYLSAAMAKLGVASRHAAAHRAWEEGWI